MILFILVIAVGVVVALIVFKTKNIIPLGTITMCTGAVKTGKSTLAVHLALKSYRSVLFRYRICKYILHRDIEKPLLYSNIPLKCNFVPLTTDILLRKVRIARKSVVLIDEASLVADSQLIKDNVVNMQLLKFFKLFGHYSHGGSMIIDSQSISDLHYSIKRCLNNYIYIYRTYRVFPFFLAMKVVEQRYSDDGSIVSTQTGDVTENLKTVIVPKNVWKKFDTYCYSVLTDNKYLYADEVDSSLLVDLKSNNIPSFRDWMDKDV